MCEVWRCDGAEGVSLGPYLGYKPHALIAQLTSSCNTCSVLHMTFWLHRRKQFLDSLVIHVQDAPFQQNIGSDHRRWSNSSWHVLVVCAVLFLG